MDALEGAFEEAVTTPVNEFLELKRCSAEQKVCSLEQKLCSLEQIVNESRRQLLRGSGLLEVRKGMRGVD